MRWALIQRRALTESGFDREERGFSKRERLLERVRLIRKRSLSETCFIREKALTLTRGLLEKKSLLDGGLIRENRFD